jgi:hypothetical protein
MPATRATPSPAGPAGPSLSDVGGWALLLALLKATLVGLVVFFLQVREVST